MFYLAWRNVSRRLGQSVVTALIILIATFVVTASLTVVVSLENGVALSRERLGADIMVLPAGASTDASEVLFTAQPVNVYLPDDTTDTVRGVAGVAQATPQFFTQTVNQSCCSVVGITRVVGIDAPSDFILKPWITTGSQALTDISTKDFDLGDDGILLGAKAPAIEGGQVSILGSTFHVVGTLEETGTSVDETIFMPLSAARTIAADSPYLTSVWNGTDPFTSVSCVMVKVDAGASVSEVVASIAQACPGVVAVAASDLVSGVSSQLSVVETLCALLLAMLVVLAALALAGRYSALVAARMKELGLMRTMGVGKGGVLASLLCEMSLITLVSAAIGALGACGASYAVIQMVHATFDVPGSVPTGGVFALSVVGGIVFALVLNAIALAQPAAKIVRADPQETLARGDL